MKNLTPFIDADGNMHLHAREGGIAVLQFVGRDMTEAQVFFEVQGFRKALTPGDTSEKMVLTIERGDLTQFMNKAANYIILDETGPVPHVITEGRVIISGWA